MATARPNFDLIARPYRWLEYLSFGPCLERARFHFLGKLHECRRAVVLGDGDGRFAARLLAANHNIHADAVDSSAAMLQLLRGRVSRLGSPAEGRLRTLHMDALDFATKGLSPETPSYDLVATHFFLDCISQEEVAVLIRNLAPRLAPGALWLISEFAIPARQPAASASRWVVSGLYRIFGLLTGLRTRRLPDYALHLRQSGFSLRDRKSHLGGLLLSELWTIAP
jgi:ubiquinone/menaquinone biosynthesis C-methylase UbiE